MPSELLDRFKIASGRKLDIIFANVSGADALKSCTDIFMVIDSVE